MKKTIGFFSLFVSAITFGSFGIWIRILNKELSINQQIIFRNGFAFIIAFFIVFLTKQLKKINWGNVKKINLILYTLLVPISVIAYNISIINTKIALATFAFYIGTIITGWVVGLFFYKEKLNLEKWLSLIMVLIGLTLFVYPFTKSSINLGFIAGIISGAIDGSANGLRKNLSGKINKSVLVLFSTIGGVFVSGLLIGYFHQNLNFIGSISTIMWIIAALFGGLLILVNYFLLIGFQNFDLSLGSIVLSLELLFSLIFGILFFKEYPSNKELLGGLFILMANIIPNLKTLLTNKVFNRNKVKL